MTRLELDTFLLAVVSQGLAQDTQQIQFSLRFTDP